LEIACQIRPLSEVGKLKLSADMTQIEFALSILHSFKDIFGMTQRALFCQEIYI
jgi:hypothetical protein